jgi:hypothetical protein
MSVTFAPNNNSLYCRQHNLVTIGEFDDEIFPFELNIANANAKNLLEILGLEPGEGLMGKIDPRTLLAAIEKLPTSMTLWMVRNPDPSVEGPGARMIDGGAGTEQGHIERYLRLLRTIAVEAERREELVVWF